jgi:hypothetical protein
MGIYTRGSHFLAAWVPLPRLTGEEFRSAELTKPPLLACRDHLALVIAFVTPRAIYIPFCFAELPSKFGYASLTVFGMYSVFAE